MAKKKKNSKKTVKKAVKKTTKKTTKKTVKKTTKKTAKKTSKRKARTSPGIGARISGAYQAVVDTVRGTDTLRNKMEKPGTSESE
jgi:hypothetical protein